MPFTLEQFARRIMQETSCDTVWRFWFDPDERKLPEYEYDFSWNTEVIHSELLLASAQKLTPEELFDLITEDRDDVFIDGFIDSSSNPWGNLRTPFNQVLVWAVLNEIKRLLPYDGSEWIDYDDVQLWLAKANPKLVG